MLTHFHFKHYTNTRTNVSHYEYMMSFPMCGNIAAVIAAMQSPGILNEDSGRMTLTNIKSHHEEAYNMIKIPWARLIAVHSPSAFRAVLRTLLIKRVLCAFATSAELIMATRE